MKSRMVCCVALVALALGWGATAAARSTDQLLPMTFKTKLTAGATYNFTFSLFDKQSGGTKLWTEGTVKETVASNHTIAHTLGSVTPFSSGLSGPVDFSQQLWVQVTGGGQTFRVKLTAVPYAFNSGSVPAASITSVEILDGSVASEDIMAGAVLAANLADGAALAEILDNDGPGSALDADTLDGLDSTAFAAGAHAHDDEFWRIDGNAGTTPGANFVGTTDIQPLELRVNGARALRIEPAPAGSSGGPNLIGGHAENTVAPGLAGAVIAGGGMAADPANPGLPGPNEVVGDLGAVVAGRGNRAGLRGFVGGGQRNLATGENAGVLGGSGNQSTGDHASVTGGSDNQANGSHAAVVGGCTNKADGYASLAAGEDALASQLGMFVWSSSSPGPGAYDQEGGFPRPTIGGTPNPLIAPSQFWVRAQGGVFFVVGEDPLGNPIGVKLVDGTGWQTIVSPTGQTAPAAGPPVADGAASPGDSATLEALHALVLDLQGRLEARERQNAATQERAVALSARIEELEHRQAELRRLVSGTSGSSGDQARK